MGKRRNNSGAAKTDAFANAMRKSGQLIDHGYDVSKVVVKWGPHTLTGFADGEFFGLSPVDLRTALIEACEWNPSTETKIRATDPRRHAENLGIESKAIDDATRKRFDAIAEIMTRLSPTAARSGDTMRFSPLDGSGLDAEYEHRLEIARSANGWCICECSWHPSAPSLTMGCGEIPADETPDQTARRLLGGLNV